MNHLLCAVGTEKLPLSLEQELSRFVKLSVHLPSTSMYSARYEIHQHIDGHTRGDIKKIAERFKIDIAILPMPRQPIKLVVFDMDSTLINGEVINELARLKGVSEKTQAITARAMNGEMDFTQSLHERVALLEGLHRHELLQVHHRLPLNPGVEKTAQVLKQHGITAAIVTGGFTFFAEEVRQRLDFSEAFANTLNFKGDQLSGKVQGHIIDGKAKLEHMQRLAQEMGIKLNEVAAVGDGANDLPMLGAAGLGVAYHAKPTVRAQAQCEITFGTMTTLLDYMGVAHAV